MREKNDAAGIVLPMKYARRSTETSYLDFEITSAYSGDSKEEHVGFEGRTPYRQIVYVGGTREEVIAAMLHGVACLAREGSLNPHDPHALGVPPIQHAIAILSERLAWQVKAREEHIRLIEEHTAPGEEAMHNHRTAHDSEVVAALGTAIAALARVREL